MSNLNTDTLVNTMLILSSDDSDNSLADTHLKTKRLWKEKMVRSADFEVRSSKRASGSMLQQTYQIRITQLFTSRLPRKSVQKWRS